MASIERHALPPLGAGPPTKLSPADRADLVKRAGEVIDDYIFGAGSWQTAGPRKSAWQTIDDLENFKREIVAREQFVEDPNSILTSIKGIADAAIKQVRDAVSMGEREDRNNKLSVPPNDRIELPSLRASPSRIPIATPQTEDQLISPPGANAHWTQVGGERVDNTEASPQRYLRGRLVDRSGRTVFETGAPPAPFLQSGPLTPQARDLSQPLRSSSGPALAEAQYGGNNVRLPDGNSSGQVLPVYPVPPILGGVGPSVQSETDMRDWFIRWVTPLMQN